VGLNLATCPHRHESTEQVLQHCSAPAHWSPMDPCSPPNPPTSRLRVACVTPSPPVPACISPQVRVCELAAEWRQEFKSDVVIDLIGYRRYGWVCGLAFNVCLLAMVR